VFSKQARIRRRMTALTTVIAEERQRLVVLDEQIGFLQGVAADAEVDAAVRGPESQAEHRAAGRDLARALRERDEVAASLARHRAEQDALLEAWSGGDVEDPGGAR
jgi:hypothetical protein